MKKVLAGGTFNLIHQGHIFFLKKARELGDSLVVVIASDRTVKGSGKPLLLSASQRKEVVESLGIADRVVIGSETDFFKVVEAERPDIIALGYDQELDKKLKSKIKQILPKCKITRVEKLEGHSTSAMLRQLGIKKKIRGQKDPNYSSSS